MVKRIILAVLLVAVLLMSVLTGCSQSDHASENLIHFVSQEKDYSFDYPNTLFIGEDTDHFMNLWSINLSQFTKASDYYAFVGNQTKMKEVYTFGVYRYNIVEITSKTPREAILDVATNSGHYNVTIKDEKQVSIGGRDAYRMTVSSYFGREPYGTVIGVPTEKGFYLLSFKNEEKFNKFTNTILSSFQFNMTK